MTSSNLMPTIAVVFDVERGDVLEEVEEGATWRISWLILGLRSWREIFESEYCATARDSISISVLRSNTFVEVGSANVSAVEMTLEVGVERSFTIHHFTPLREIVRAIAQSCPQP